MPSIRLKYTGGIVETGDEYAQRLIAEGVAIPVPAPSEAPGATESPTPPPSTRSRKSAVKVAQN